MKVSYKHIINYINDKPNVNDLSEKLFQLGHEHEIDGDIIDLELTPNRGDCLSLRGLLRDLNLFYDVDFTQNIYEKNINHFDFKFSNNAIEACPKISFLNIEIESIPDNYNNELESYFSSLEINKNNFFTDLSNYLSYETGQPIHCYEASKIRNGIKLDFSKQNEEFHTLLDQKIEINPKDLIFLNNQNEIINLAGVMGGMNSSCTINTKKVIVECAYFNPEIIIGKALKHSINSEAAHKFERNTDPDSHEYVLRRFVKLVQEHSKIKNVEICSNDNYKSPQKIINFDVNKINLILGTDVTMETCSGLLKRLGFIIDNEFIRVPSYRHDILSINDIAEEIARAIGYNNIDSKRFIISKDLDNQITINKETKIKNLLTNNGFCEVINDPFTAEFNDGSLEVDNPLDSNRRFLRTSLKASLLENLLYNERRQQDSIKLFEIADIYSIKFENPKKFIGIIVSGRVDKNYEDFSSKLDQKYLDAFIRDNFNYTGQSNCELISRENIKSKSSNPIAYIEIEINESIEISNFYNNVSKTNLDIKYVPISDYPSSKRDLSFSVSDFTKCELLQKYILNFKDELLKDVFIFDYFLNEKNKEIKIGFRFVFQSTKSTIKEEEVNKVIDQIIIYTKTINGVVIPGLK